MGACPPRLPPLGLSVGLAVPACCRRRRHRRRCLRCWPPLHPPAWLTTGPLFLFRSKSFGSKKQQRNTTGAETPVDTVVNPGSSLLLTDPFRDREAPMTIKTVEAR